MYRILRAAKLGGACNAHLSAVKRRFVSNLRNSSACFAASKKYGQYTNFLAVPPGVATSVSEFTPSLRSFCSTTTSSIHVKKEKLADIEDEQPEPTTYQSNFKNNAQLLSRAVRNPISLHEVAMVDMHYPNDTPFQKLDCDVAFRNLTKEEKLYTHYISRAAWESQIISMFQVSPESPLIFILLDKILRVKSSVPEVVAHLKQNHGFSDDETTAFLVYAGAFMANSGNYRGFGDTKFVPNVSIDKFTSVAKEVLSSDELPFFTKHCIEQLYDYESRVRSLGFPPASITTYWSANCNENDAKFVTEFLNSKKVEVWNSRVFKTAANTDGNDKDEYEIRFASKQLTDEPDTTAEQLIGHKEEYKGRMFKFTRGDYSELMPAIISNLKLAVNTSLNDNQKNMLNEYIKYFDTGSLTAHKNGSRYWIKDKGPTVEAYIGFIETYRDPAGVRAEFEAFTAVVNKESSKVLGELVYHAEEIIKSSLPWPKEFEKDEYLRPDFTALDIVTFSGSSIPAGINIPNYDEIRQNEGFKNVHLLNVVKAGNAAMKIKFVSDEDAELIKMYREAACEVQLALHELLGHGSGKLFSVNESGTLNFNHKNTKNPLNGNEITSYYRPGETFNSIFTDIASSYEECRAECVGIFLSTFPNVLKVFRSVGKEADNLMYVNWLSMMITGLRSLEHYNSDTGKWNQAHANARFVILSVLLEGSENLIEIKIVTNKEDGKPDLLVTLKRDEILKSGKNTIAKFLLKLQVYKATADIESARKMYMEYSQVKKRNSIDFVEIRNIIIDRKRPRAILVQSATRLDKASGEVELLTYDNSPEGFAKSWLDHYPKSEPLYKQIKTLYNKDLKYFPVQ
ncbi:dipeptidyl peptidase 3-like isoform X3 [Varroa jacobsoni]|uniref:dipeptidyl peptidase 3-like isoform X3 n=1 Tax=Varroa jacobsoni TaxID=62625 RepID=UPI000BFA9677|nr:dipeptidyl peptidase 3-like isoform X3 [Varroa jacobsoni]